MQIKQRLDSKKKHLLMSQSIKSHKNTTVLNPLSVNAQTLLKEFKNFYDSKDNEVLKIRTMTKWQLSAYMRKIDSNKAIQIARKIKDRREFNKYVGKDIQAMLSNYMFAYHKLLSFNK
tara:strand:- start:5457 stop:5810 length:354 start_codon:yes stop_codon:yes gene_type:complete